MKGYTNFQILNHREGRFGNQLFRIGTMIGQSLQNNCGFYIPTEWEHKNLFPNLPFYDKNQIEKNINKIHQELKFGFHEIPISDKIIELKGYFQSVNFFDEYRNIVKKYLSLNSDTVTKIKNNLNSESKKLSIHIRWGDPYDRSVGGGHKGIENKHPTMTLNYYYSSIEYILSKVNVDEIFLFTDNIDTKDFIFGKFEKFNIPIKYFDYNDDYIYDFICQYICDYFIIANSTFSFWSAYLSENINKIVCCPFSNEWFGVDYKNLDTSTITPLDWIKIKQ